MTEDGPSYIATPPEAASHGAASYVSYSSYALESVPKNNRSRGVGGFFFLSFFKKGMTGMTHMTSPRPTGHEVLILTMTRYMTVIYPILDMDLVNVVCYTLLETKIDHRR